MQKLKKFFIGGTAFLLSVAFLTGCSVFGKDSDSSEDQSSSDSELTPPDDRADVTGTVLTVEGNEITIQQVVREEGEEPEDLGDEERENIKEDFESMSDEEKEAMREERQGGREEISEEDRQAKMEEMQANMEYEEVVLTIPVGVTVVKSETEGDEGEEMQPGMEGSVQEGDRQERQISYSEVTLADIEEDMSISIWKDGDEIIFVLISEAGGGMGGFGGPGGGFEGGDMGGGGEGGPPAGM